MNTFDITVYIDFAHHHIQRWKFRNMRNWEIIVAIDLQGIFFDKKLKFAKKLTYIVQIEIERAEKWVTGSAVGSRKQWTKTRRFQTVHFNLI